MIEKIKKILPHVKKPARYIGNEINIVKKDLNDISLRMAISYPDVYEIGMSNLAIRILYDIVNSINDFYCERVFAPWLDFEEELRKNKIPLFSLETYTPINQFDVVGFSLGCELLYTNLLTILDLGRIPIYSSDRDGQDPLIIAGGPSVFNPEPISDFIDVFIVGDGEIALIEFLKRLLSLRDAKKSKKLNELNNFDFTYIPSLYKKMYYRGYTFTDIDKKVNKRIEPDLNALFCPEKPIVPLIKIIQDRVSIEVSRGCTNGCRFCQAGFTYRPVRERSVRNIVKILRSNIKNSGYDKISFSSLSISDYSKLKTLVEVVNNEFSHENVSISLPSLRVNSTNIAILRMIQKVRKSGLTFAIESADKSIRKVLNKSVDEDQLKKIINEVSSLGWRLVKLYLMIGLPESEDEEKKITDFLLRFTKITKRLSINVNVSVFVPKPHTPLERENQISLNNAERIINNLRNRFKNSKVSIKFQNPRMSVIEGILSRGDRKVSDLIYQAYLKGERFSSWDEVFNYNIWCESIKRLGIDVEKYNSFDSSLDHLPWDFINTGVTKSYILDESIKARDKSITKNCIYNGCTNCGVCRNRISNRLAKGYEENLIEEKEVKTLSIGGKSCKPYKVIFQFKKGGMYRFISHLDLLNLLIKIGKINQIPFKYSEGYNPRPRVIIPFPLPLGIESDYEIGEVFLDREIQEEDFIGMYNKSVDNDLMIENVIITSERKSIASRPFYHDYLLFLEGKKPDDVISLINNDITFGDTVVGGPNNYFTISNGSIFIRLEAKKSIKSIFKEGSSIYIDFPIKRVMIWELRDENLIPFL